MPATPGHAATRCGCLGLAAGPLAAYAPAARWTLLEETPIASHDLTQGSIRGHTIGLALPVASAMLLQSLYALVDLAFVGRLGGQAVAGLSISFQAFFIVLAISQAVATTAIAEVSQAWGAGKLDDGRSAFTMLCVVGLVVGLVAALAAYLSADLYVSLFAGDPEVHRLGLEYFRVTALSFLLQLLLLVFGNGLRGSGDFTTPMKFMALSVLINMVLDPLLIFGLGPFPRMGLAGAAWATVTAQAITNLAYLRRLSTTRDPRGLRFARPTSPRRLLGRILVRGLPASVQFLMMSAVVGMVLAAMKPHGASWTATAGGGFRVLQQSFLPMVALGSACAAIVGQNLGARQPARVARAIRTALTWAAGYALMLGIALFFLGRWAGHVFAKGQHDLDLAAVYFRWSAPALPAFAASIIPMFALQAAGRAVLPMLAALARVAALALLIFAVIVPLSASPVWVFGAATATAYVEAALALLIIARFARTLRDTLVRPLAAAAPDPA